MDIPEDYLIQILVRLPIPSLLRFKSVSKSWLALIDNSFFIDLHTTTTTTPSKFGSFIIQAAVNFRRFRENALVMLSSESSESCVSSARSVVSGSGSSSWGWWNNGGSNGVCGRCVSGSPSESESRFGGWLWMMSNDTRSNGLCVQCGQWSSYRVAEGDDPVFKLDNNNLTDDDQQQQQQHQLVFKLDTFGFPSCYNFGKIKGILMVGSCNGLVCLVDESINEGGGDDFSLWNPATRQFRILPKSITNEGDYPVPLYAFGFDAQTKDYKVVIVSVCRDTELPYHPCRVQVYSLSSDSWRLLEGITCLPSYPFFEPSMGLYLNGTCFFIARFPGADFSEWLPEFKFMLSFDLTKEIIIPFRLPQHHPLQEVLYLCSLGDKVTLFTAAPYIDGDEEDTTGCGYEYFNIWVLNEYGSTSTSNENKEFLTKMNYGSWTKICSFQIECKISGECHKPIGISNDGEFALLETNGGNAGCGMGSKNMKLYNLVTKEVKKSFLSCDQLLSTAYAYKPSLVSVIGGGNGSNSR